VTFHKKLRLWIESIHASVHDLFVFLASCVIEAYGLYHLILSLFFHR
jgi:hypothetical protein